MAKVYLDMWDEGIITDFEELKGLVNYRDAHGTERYRKSSTEKAEPLTTGTTAAPGFHCGRVVFLHSTIHYGGYGGGNVLVAKMTSTEDLAKIQNCEALITLEGGYTSHPAIVARELKKPCLVAIKDSHFEDEDTVVIGGVRFKEGDEITVFADTGEVYQGAVKSEEYNSFDERMNELRKKFEK